MSHTDTDVLSVQQVANLHGASLSGADMSLNQESAKDKDTPALTFVGMLAAGVSSGEFDLP